MHFGEQCKVLALLPFGPLRVASPLLRLWEPFALLTSESFEKSWSRGTNPKGRSDSYKLWRQEPRGFETKEFILKNHIQ